MKCKFGVVGVREIIEWIMYLILAAVGFVVAKNIFSRFG